MQKLFSIIIGIVILGGVLFFGGAFYIVNESEQVVITQFGKPVGDPITTPGLKIKKPFLETANYFDKRFLAWDGEPKQVSTRDKRFITLILMLDGGFQTHCNMQKVYLMNLERKLDLVLCLKERLKMQLQNMI